MLVNSSTGLFVGDTVGSGTGIMAVGSRVGTPSGVAVGVYATVNPTGQVGGVPDATEY